MERLSPTSAVATKAEYLLNRLCVDGPERLLNPANEAAELLVKLELAEFVGTRGKIAEYVGIRFSIAATDKGRKFNAEHPLPASVF